MPLRKKIKSGYIIAFVLLMISYFFIFRSTWTVQREYDWVTNSYKAENQIGELKNSIVEAETSVRGYYITKDQAFLRPYRENQENINLAYNELKALEAKNKTQLAKLDTIKQLIDLRLSLMKNNIAAFQLAGEQTTPEVEFNRRRGQSILDSIRIHTQHFIASEEKLMAERKDNLTKSFKTTQIIIFISLITSIIAILYSLFTYIKESAARDESTKKNIQYQQELETKIEELKRMDAEVRELKGMEKFTATGRVARTIAHEVRNPLTNISLAAEQLQEMAIQNSESSMLLDMISRNGIRINQLISDLLNATKAIELNIKKTNINKVLDKALEMASDRIDLSQVKVEKKYADNICDVSIDEEKTKIAFLNIIVNAIEAMEKNKGILTLRTKSAGDHCIIEIEDNGNGMDDETLQKLFEPYFTNKSKGNGLGLTNCQNIIMSHRGKIAVQSKVGKGSLFIVTLKIDE
ncbi:MAG TPA: CHASE3 domain-containing protein [Chitinophagaceae bacterium]|nr:CHASE3 domain-containing protein [Chitinophagaceae bacterium]